MKTKTYVLLIVLFSFSLIIAQDKEKKDDEKPSTKIINSTQSTGDKINFKDDNGNTLISITDEGTTGSITIPLSGSAPSSTTNKLYNVGSTLFFNGGAVGSGGGVTSLGGLSDAINNGYDLYLGNGAGVNNNGNNFNTAVGNDALHLNTIGINNIANGESALYHNTGGSYNTANGESALYWNTTGNYNTANGAQSLGANTTGYSNTADGFDALFSNTTGNYNTANGVKALFSNEGGNSNTANGEEALYSNTTGGFNTANGVDAMYFNTTGSDNIAIGNAAGYNLTTGSNNIFIGYYAQASSNTVSNEITLGNSSISSLRCNVNSISSLSDMRDKKNIRDLPLGLDFLMTIKPRMFNWDRRDWYESGIADGSKIQETPTAGFVAQELDEAQTKANAEWLNLVLKSNPERLEATYGNLLPIVVKAIQDLKKENNELKERLDKLNSSISTMVKNEVSKVLTGNVQADQKYVKIN